ncbi:putative sugar nucleotidyl transferase [Sphingobacterium hungaricum]|uniref:Transferase n=1 Tax=Sphingobacterium hungaricum TaxID=2082723 RepID=A0A928UTR8_9SPHI|nr:putative sugar nucleotidyl transferase [Sphingobacterium hungaricum]MBE8712582.1 transferase [Sphingobacterium hungaricum]
MKIPIRLAYRDFLRSFIVMSVEIVLFDRAPWRSNLLPLVATRPVGNLRVGILTLDEKWSRLFQTNSSFLTEDYLQNAFIAPNSQSNEFLVIRADFLPSPEFVEALTQLKISEVLVFQNEWLAYRTDRKEFPNAENLLDSFTKVDFEGEVKRIEHPEHIFLYNAEQIKLDFELITNARSSKDISATNVVLGNDLFVEENVSMENCSLNTTSGPIYIGKNAVIEEGSFLKGPIAIGEGSKVKMGSKIYPNVTVGNGSTIAGEVNNTVIWGDSAKGHDGYLGCAVIGQYCNFGAGSTNSNLRNDWKTVTLYSYTEQNFRDTHLLKCGMIMGDFSFCGIQSSFTTGTVIGAGVQLALLEYVPRFVSDFTWLTNQKDELYDWQKFVNMLERRGKATGNFLNEEKTLILKAVFEQAKENRKEFKSTLK